MNPRLPDDDELIKPLTDDEREEEDLLDPLSERLDEESPIDLFEDSFRPPDTDPVAFPNFIQRDDRDFFDLPDVRQNNRQRIRHVRPRLGDLLPSDYNYDQIDTSDLANVVHTATISRSWVDRSDLEFNSVENDAWNLLMTTLINERLHSGYNEAHRYLASLRFRRADGGGPGRGEWVSLPAFPIQTYLYQNLDGSLDIDTIKRNLVEFITFSLNRLNEEYDEDNIEYDAIGVQVHMIDLIMRGSCSSYEATGYITICLESGQEMTLKVKTVRSKNNMCGLASLIWWVRYRYKNQPCICGGGTCLKHPDLPYRQHSQYLTRVLGRKKGDSSHIRLDEFPLLAKCFNMDIKVINGSMETLLDYRNHYPRKCTLILDHTSHHYLILLNDVHKITPPSNRHNRKRCTDCGIVLQSNHRCEGLFEVEEKKRILAIQELYHELEDQYPDHSYKSISDIVFNQKKNVFLTGAAGSGKSYTIRALQKESSLRGFQEGEFVTVSTTGVSALEIDGYVLHSYFGIGIFDKDPQVLTDIILKNVDICKRIKLLKVLVIDEVSMLDGDILCYLDKLWKIVRQVDELFGGIIVVFTGDFLQLPPVKKSRFVFETDLWVKIEDKLEIIYLKGSKRFDEQVYTNIMSRVRRNIHTVSDLDFFRKKVCDVSEAKLRCQAKNLFPTILFPRVNDVNEYNRNEVSKLSGRKYSFLSNDNFEPETKLSTKGLPPKKIDIMIGMQVMCTCNNWKSFGIANGSIGIVRSVLESNKLIEIEFNNGVTHVVNQIKHTVRHRSRVLTRIQFPLTMAWALTIHKAQGKTLDAVIIDCGKGVFAHSQAYVALSRVKSHRNLHLVNFHPSAFKVNRTALRFERFCMQWKKCGEHFPQGSREEIISQLRVNGDRFSHDHIFSVRDTVTNAIEFNPKPESKDMLKSKTIFYDYETFYDHVGKKEVPYFNNYQVYEYGRRTVNAIMCALCTTDININDAFFEAIMTLIIKHKDEYVRQRTANVSDRSQWNHLAKPWILCAYNGSGFDFHFFMQTFLQKEQYASRFEVSTVLKGSKVMAFDLWDRKSQTMALKTHDIFNITGCSLSRAAKDFLGTMQKDVFPHLWVNKVNLEKARHLSHVILQKSDFPISMRDVMGEMCAKGELNIKKYPFHQNLHSYGIKDVNLLICLYEKMDTLVRQSLQTSILQFMTLSKLTWYGFLSHLDNKFLQNSSFSSHRSKKRRTLIYRTSILDDRNIRQSIIGGKCYPRIMDWQSKDYGKSYEEIKDYYVDADIVSMYVFTMIERDMPFGLEQHLTTEDELKPIRDKKTTSEWDPMDKKNNFMILLVDFRLHPSEIEPVISRRERTGGIGDKMTYKLKWDNSRRTQWITSIDLFLIMKNEGTVFEIKEAYSWPKRDALFRKWVTKTFQEKQRAAKEGKLAAKQYYKTCGNGCYGSSLQRTFNDMTVFVRDTEDLRRFHEQYNWVNTLNWDAWEEKKNSFLVLRGERKVYDKYEWTNRPRYLGAFILAWTRYQLDHIISVINPYRREGSPRSVFSQVLYGDTDSLLIHCSALSRLKSYFGEEAGKLGDDLYSGWNKDPKNPRFAKITRFCCGAPKSYAIQAVMPPEYADIVELKGKAVNDTQVQFKGKTYTFQPHNSTCTLDIIKLKGITAQGFSYNFKGEDYNCFTFDLLQQIMKSNESVVVQMKNRILRNGVNVSFNERKNGVNLFRIYRKDVERTLFKSKWKGRKRVIKESAFTVPSDWIMDETKYTDKDFVY